MNVVIVGGTSQVATELCMLFRERGVDVHPTVRSRVGASFYDHHGVDYRVVDVTDRTEARTALRDADVVAIAAFARQYSRGFSPRRARKTNEQIIRNTVDAAPRDTTIVYFSTIAAFGKEVGFSNWDSYGREKRHAENVLVDALEARDKEGYAFRMGPIYGVNQNKAAQIETQIEQHRSSDELAVAVDPDRPSNVLHTVTLMNAIEHAAEKTFEREVFTLLNVPRWTWRDLVEYYTPEEVTLSFRPPDEDSLTGRMLQHGKQLAESHERSLRGLSVYLPERMNQRIFNEYVKRDVANDIGSTGSKDPLRLPQFDEEPAPNPEAGGLTPTHDLLSLEDEVEQVFRTEFEVSG
jgi:nucleoside-diphosphate-sugar epimerase